MLASQYNWSKTEILEKVYIEDVERLSILISIRKIQDYMMQIAIVSSPHSQKPDSLFKELQMELDTLKKPKPEPLDKKGFEAFKNLLNASEGIKVK